MSRINVLDKHVAELIAAGEVVERPASVVKELIENAIDAGATDITVEIADGGVRLIRVSDNGCGISREDIPKAFVRHATSKVCNAEDLDRITTLGFRGEALASVAAMCKVELLTKTESDDEATLYRIEGGEEISCGPAARPAGTTVTVSDIFYNTPARMKFLKKDVSEGNSVAQTVDRAALSHPDVAFTFIRDGAKKLKTSGNGELLAVIYAIYGREFAAEMIPVDYEYEDFARVSGYISKPAASKPGRTYQCFFINGRFVRTKTGMAALEEAFKGKIMHGKFPACFLNIELDFAGVDVNVHPAKTEIRFVNERPVFSSVYYAVKSALQKLEAPAAFGMHNTAEKPPEPTHMALGEYRALYENAAEIFVAQERPGLYSQRPAMHSARIDIEVSAEEKHASKADSAKIQPEAPVKIIYTNAINPPQNATIALDGQNPAQREYGRVIGELFTTYILVEEPDGLVLVDKHAVHERLIYERLKAGAELGSRQTLLSPVSVGLNPMEHAALMENPEQVAELGFLVEDFGGNTVVVREVPQEFSDKLSSDDVAYMVREIAEKLLNHAHDITPQIMDRLYYSIACRAALKAGDKNSPEEMFEILRQLRENPSVTHCPHGRPVETRVSRREIEKMFGRLP